MPRRHLKLPICSPQEVEQFLSAVNRTPGQGPKGACWGFHQNRSGDWYNSFAIQGQQYRAHRLAYYFATALDPGPLNVCHHCDWPPCCRPEHLFAGTDSDNARDMVSKGRNRTKTRPDSVRRGETHPDAVLTESKVTAMRVLYAEGVLVMQEIADRFQVGLSAVQKILRADTWAHVDGPTYPPTQRLFRYGESMRNAKLTAEKVRDIRDCYASGGSSFAALAREYGVAAPTIAGIVHRRYWKHLP